MKKQYLPIILIIYSIVSVLCIVLSVANFSTDSHLSLLTYLLFFTTTLKLCKTKRQWWIFSTLLILVIGATVVLDAVAFSLSKEMPTAIPSMKMMTAATIIQNLVLTIYLFACSVLLW